MQGVSVVEKRWVTKARQDRDKAIGILGGACARCGATDQRILEIDHIDPVCRDTSKAFTSSGSYTVRRVLKGETKNLQVLCANCHKIKTYEEGWRARC